MVVGGVYMERFWQPGMDIRGGKLFDGDRQSVGRGGGEGQGLKKIWERKAEHDGWRIWGPLVELLNCLIGI